MTHLYTSPSWVITVTISSHIIILLTFFLYELHSRMLCAQWTYHVTLARLLVRFLLYHMFPARVLVCPRSHFHMTCHFTISDCRLIYAYISRLCLLLSTRLQSRYSWTMTRLWLVSLLQLFVLVSRSLIYMWLGMRTHSSSSIYFATTLKVRPARSHELSSSLLVCWSRLLLRVS